MANESVVAAGSALALAGSLLFLIDVWPVLRRPHE